MVEENSGLFAVAVVFLADVETRSARTNTTIAIRLPATYNAISRCQYCL